MLKLQTDTSESSSERGFLAAPDLLVVFSRASLKIQSINHAEAFGFERNKLLGQPISNLISGTTEELVERVIVGSHDPHRDAPLRATCVEKDGRETPIDVKISAIDFAHAIAAIRRIPETARIAERELVTIVCSSPVAIVTWNREGIIVSWNPGAERLYGLHASEAIGSSILKLVPEEGQASFLDVQRRLLAGDKVGIQEPIRLRGSQEIVVEEHLFVVRDYSPHPLRVGCFSRDLGEVSRLRKANQILSGTHALKNERWPTSSSPKMSELLNDAQVAAAESDATILLLGETGVGKSWLARRIHASSPRSEKPFLELNCSSFESQLLESELFGYERGAFTGATTPKPGLIELAEGGTLFLDEVAELSPAAQSKLLSFLDTRQFRRLGGTRILQGNVRVIAATNVELEAAVESKVFRKDLYFRLRVMPIDIPPLRERMEDFDAVVSRILIELGRRTTRIEPSALDLLKSYSWPGNLRELRNALERALILSRGTPIRATHLPKELLREKPSSARTGDLTLKNLEERHILEVLERMGGNQSRAAESLGIDRTTLRRKLLNFKASSHVRTDQ